MEVLKAAVEAMAAGRQAALVTVVDTKGSAPREAGARMLVFNDGSSTGTIGGGAVEHAATKQALQAMAEGRPRRFSPHLGKDLGMSCGGSMDIFLQPLIRPPRLVIFGAGHVAHATAPVARQLGFEVTIVDERAEQATEQRFPGCRLLLEAPEQAAQNLDCDDDTWFLVVTHGHGYDLAVLRVLARRPWAWLGAIASRRKAATFRAQLSAEGIPDETLARISSPVGLDLGARTPAEIAISVAAEWVRTRRDCARVPLPLRDGGRDA